MLLSNARILNLIIFKHMKQFYLSFFSKIQLKVQWLLNYDYFFLNKAAAIHNNGSYTESHLNVIFTTNLNFLRFLLIFLKLIVIEELTLKDQKLSIDLNLFHCLMKFLPEISEHFFLYCNE